MKAPCSLFAACALSIAARGAEPPPLESATGANGPGAAEGLGRSRGGPLVVAGYAHSCATDVAGKVFCWGDNSKGELGNGGTASSAVPVEVYGLPGPVTALSAGGGYTCAVSAGRVYCWGDDYFGGLGDGKVQAVDPSPVAFGGPALEGTRFTDVRTEADSMTVCALADTGQVWCAGYNNHGQLGAGITNDSPFPVRVRNVTGPIVARSLAVGGDFGCATAVDPAHYACWGDNDHGQFGNVSAAGSLFATLVPGTYALLFAGAGSVCGLVPGRPLECWGAGAGGQRAHGGWSDGYMVSKLPNVVNLSLGASHTCAVVEDGRVFCWGDNGSGQLGDGSMTNQDAPVKTVQGLPPAAAVAAGLYHTCAATQDGHIWCWGWNSSGEVGPKVRIGDKAGTPVLVR